MYTNIGVLNCIALALNSYDHCTLQLSIDAVRGSPINPAAELVNEEPSFSQGEQSMEENIKPMDFFVAGSCFEIAIG